MLGFEQRNGRIWCRFSRGHSGCCVGDRCRETRRDTKIREEAAAIVQERGALGRVAAVEVEPKTFLEGLTTGRWDRRVRDWYLRDLSVLSLGPPCPAPLP